MDCLHFVTNCLIRDCSCGTSSHVALERFQAVRRTSSVRRHACHTLYALALLNLASLPKFRFARVCSCGAQAFSLVLLRRHGKASQTPKTHRFRRSRHTPCALTFVRQVKSD